eukprot:3436314-Amphidinium_carterae.2
MLYTPKPFHSSHFDILRGVNIEMAPTFRHAGVLSAVLVLAALRYVSPGAFVQPGNARRTQAVPERLAVGSGYGKLSMKSTVRSPTALAAQDAVLQES